MHVGLQSSPPGRLYSAKPSGATRGRCECWPKTNSHSIRGAIDTGRVLGHHDHFGATPERHPQASSGQQNQQGQPSRKKRNR
eukprot:5513517-Pyramimonas_sp.AAC.1